MLVGNGLIASAFREYESNEEFLFFCSGVSNSTCKDQLEFKRETDLLHHYVTNHGGKTLIYFSTCSIEDPSMAGSLYVKHKSDIESTIISSCDSFHIFRLSNVVGHTSNKTTILNFLYNAIQSNQSFDLWINSNRNLIDVDDVAAIVKSIVRKQLLPNSVKNIANKDSYDVSYIVSEIEEYLGKKGNYNSVDKGARFTINTEAIDPILNKLNIDFGASYLKDLLEKYYSK